MNIRPLKVRTETELSLPDARYLAKVREATRRLGRRSDDAGGLPAALADLDDAAMIDTDVPTVAQRPAVSLVKRAVKALVGWYLRYLAQQVTVLGQATSRLATILAQRADAIDGRTAALTDEVSTLRARVEALERRLPVGDDRT